MRRITLVLLMAAVAGNAWSLELNRFFSDNMVLQRHKPLTIRGTAAKDAEVTVTFSGQTKSATADVDGVWSVTLAPMPANAEGQTLTASTPDARPLTRNNIVVGDVFLHARQTSIDISLGRNEQGQQAAAAMKPNPLFRKIYIKAIPSAVPLHDLAKEATTGWTVVDKASALQMTDSAFYLGRDLVQKTDVPIGIVDVNLGYAFPNSWLSREELLVTGRYPNDTQVARDVDKYEALLEAELKGEPLGRQAVIPENTLLDPLYPAAGFNGTLHPLAGTALKAAVVQLGNNYPYMFYQQLLESADPSDYDELDRVYKDTYNLRKDGFRMEDSVVPRITREWRRVLGNEELPFGLIVPPASELHTFALHHREMRELQRLVAEDAEGVGIILPGMEHIPFSAQPADGALLGKRSLSWIAGDVYQTPDMPATGPAFDRFEAYYNEATIYFIEGTAAGLQAEGNALDFFEVADVEGEYAPAQAEIDGETIRLHSDSVTRIARVRYNWKKQPNQGLVNAVGLPAIPFRSERPGYQWFFRNEEDDLPEEFFLPANEWQKNDVTLINVALRHHGYDNFSGVIGPAGFRVGPFGPNMGVGEIVAGSPADGTLFPGDVIYSANGTMLGDQPWIVMANAITESETRQGRGKLVLGVRRGTENIDVELTLPVMGTYSSTSPYDCPKTERILEDLEEWITSGAAREDRRPDFLGTDTLFMLATGNPELLGYARRAIYNKIARTQIVEEIDPRRGPRAWFPAWDSLLLGEYYMATGDRNVLPYLKYHLDVLAAMQHPLGSWRHNYPGNDGYGLMPALGLAATIGFHLADAAGLDINQEAYRKAVSYHHDGSGQMGRIIYGVGAGVRPAPAEFEPEQIQNGLMSTANGALGAAAVLFDLEGKTPAAHLCSFISAHSWNTTFPGHGGNFWNNFWTPLGARVHGKQTFIHFWENYRWYRELGRTHDGTFNFDNFKGCAGFGIPLLVPRQRLQIVGAPPSPFAANAPQMLEPALAAYWQKDYEEAEKRANELIASGAVSMDDMPTVQYFARAAKEMQQSIADDLARMQRLAAAGELAEAKSFMAGLKGVLPEDDARLTALEVMLADTTVVIQPDPEPEPETAEEESQEEAPRQWVVLVMESDTDKADKRRGDRRGPVITAEDQQPNRWRLEVIEGMNHAPEGWFKPEFDDSKWLETNLPTSWRMYHTALLRTRFHVEDKDIFDGLRMHSWILRQQNVNIYLNGELIAKVSGAGNRTNFEAEFKSSALKPLKNGENTLAITARQNWRWGHGALSVYNGGFDFKLDARLGVDSL